jgi:hypothetical protein
MTEDPIELVVEPRPRDIGGFEVRRLLPVAQRRSVGPFVFFDQMGPATIAAEHGVDVGRIRISDSPPSPISFRARSCIAIRWDRCR